MARKYLLSVSLLSSNGSACSAAMSVHPIKEEAEEASREAQDAINNILKDAFLYVPGESGMAEPLMSLQEFLARYLKTKALRCVISDVQDEDIEIAHAGRLDA